jgi:hypothetical protein
MVTAEKPMIQIPSPTRRSRRPSELALVRSRAVTIATAIDGMYSVRSARTISAITTRFETGSMARAAQATAMAYSGARRKKAAAAPTVARTNRIPMAPKGVS